MSRKTSITFVSIPSFQKKKSLPCQVKPLFVVKSTLEGFIAELDHKPSLTLYAFQRIQENKSVILKESRQKERGFYIVAYQNEEELKKEQFPILQYVTLQEGLRYISASSEKDVTERVQNYDPEKNFIVYISLKHQGQTFAYVDEV